MYDQIQPPLVGNGSADGQNGRFFNFRAHDAQRYIPSINLESGKLQYSMKVKKIVQLPGTKIPTIHKLKMKIRFRDLDLNLKNKEAYND